jgi:hypothetical protein
MHIKLDVAYFFSFIIFSLKLFSFFTCHLKGLTVSIGACFINREVRVEFVLFLYDRLDRLWCLKADFRDNWQRRRHGESTESNRSNNVTESRDVRNTNNSGGSNQSDHLLDFEDSNNNTDGRLNEIVSHS